MIFDTTACSTRSRAERLQAERDYTEAAMADTVVLQETLFKELKGRIKEADESVPIRCRSPGATQELQAGGGCGRGMSMMS